MKKMIQIADLEIKNTIENVISGSFELKTSADYSKKNRKEFDQVPKDQ